MFPGELVENFQNHPPLVLPETGYVLDLSLPVDDPIFKEIVQETNIVYSQTEGEAKVWVSEYIYKSMRTQILLNSQYVL